VHRTLSDIIAIMFAILFKRKKQKPNRLNKKKAPKSYFFDAFALDDFFIQNSKKIVNTLTEFFFNDTLPP